MAPQAMATPPPMARAELPPAMNATQSALNMAQQGAGVAPEEGGQMNVDLLAQAQYVAQYLLGLDENSRLMALMNLRQQSQEFYQVVLGLMQSMIGEGGAGGGGAAGEPLPEQRPPQREAAVI